MFSAIAAQAHDDVGDGLPGHLDREKARAVVGKGAVVYAKTRAGHSQCPCQRNL